MTITQREFNETDPEIVPLELLASADSFIKELAEEASTPGEGVDRELLALLGLRNYVARQINATFEGSAERARHEQEYQVLQEEIAPLKFIDK